MAEPERKPVGYLLGVDIGTYGSKATVSAPDGSIVYETAVEHELSLPHAGWAEHDADTVWWNDFRRLCSLVLDHGDISAERIRAVSTSAIAPCVLPLDAGGRALRPAILYGVDTRSVEEIEELTELLGTDWLLKHAGCHLSTQSAGPKIRWLQKHEPQVWKKTARIVTSTSYLCLKLTGNCVIDHYTAAFYAPLYDLHELGWSAEAARHICDPSLLPTPMWSAEQAGVVTAQAAKETGLREGTPVMAGTADAAAEAVSAGVSRPGEVMLMHGSSLFLISISDSLPQGGIFWAAPFLFPDTYALAGGMATTGAITQWFRRNFTGPLHGGPRASEVADSASDSGEGPGGSPGEVFRLLAEEAAEVPPGSDGLIALPYFSGERTPINDPNARGVLAGLTLRHSRAHVYRALLEGVAYGVRHNFEALEASGTPIRSVTAVGGGTRNRTWMHIVGDVTEREQLIRPESSASRGDAFLAGIGTGAIAGQEGVRGLLSPGESLSPDPQNAAKYRDGYRLYRQLYESSKETIGSLAALSSRA